MPMGIFAVGLCIIVGGLSGTLVGKRLPDKFKTSLPITFSLAVMAIGVTNVVKTNSLPPIMIALFFGTVAGMSLNLERQFRHAGEYLAGLIVGDAGLETAHRARNLEMFSLAIVLFCTGPVGIYGAMHSSMTGDHSILFAKCLMDLFTSFIFAASAGRIIAFLAVPVVAVLLVFYALAGTVAPFITPVMLADFSGCGGMIVIGVALRMAEIRMYHVSDMLPALLLVMPVSWLWGLLPL